nr:helix-turn-helix domain-containing protein [uncultured Celeribacter sp.]
MTDDHSPKLVPAVQNATAIQRLLVTAGRPMGVTQIARETDLNVSSVFNILRTLSHEGLVSFDPVSKTYETSLGVLEFALPLLGAKPADLLRPICRGIAQDHNVMLALWQITQTERIVLIDNFSAPNIVQAVLSPNSRLPAFVGAVGRCYAAALDLDEAATRAGYDTVRWQKAPGFEAFWQDVNTARETRRAEDRGNLFRGLDIVASLARDANGVPRLGLSSITISEQLDTERLDAVSVALANATAQIERSLFGLHASN